MKGKRFLFSGLIAILLLFGLIAPQAAEAKDIIVNEDPTDATLSGTPAEGMIGSAEVVEVMV